MSETAPPALSSPPGLRILCRETELAEGASRGFPPAPGGFTGLFAVRKDGHVHVYVNACPHIGVALDWTPDRFLTADGAHIVCSTHGALFSIADGACIRGPCRGDALEAVAVTLADGMVLVPEDAGL
ncbi:MAG: Rieske (2Fe-2S) protein [Rhodospirillales bacterium]|nr:Rieske (2Fe-2S) protein [Rhodospirillales bacterium]